jgi:hypothetical protein
LDYAIHEHDDGEVSLKLLTLDVTGQLLILPETPFDSIPEEELIARVTNLVERKFER